MWSKLILAATALAAATADGAANPAFLQACEAAGDAGCAEKLASAAAGDDVATVEATGRNALIIGLGIFPVVFVVMYVSAKLFGPRAAPAPVAPIKAPKPKKNKRG